jgi:hypothetical protein
MSFHTEAIKTIHSSNTLNSIYFSESNIEKIQQNIIQIVRQKQKYIIKKQSPIELKIIMRSIYLQYSKHLDTEIESQVTDLNQLTVDECVPNIISNIQQYLKYRKDKECLPIPLEHPKHMSSAGTKTLTMSQII